MRATHAILIREVGAQAGLRDISSELVDQALLPGARSRHAVLIREVEAQAGLRDISYELVDQALMPGACQNRDCKTKSWFSVF